MSLDITLDLHFHGSPPKSKLFTELDLPLNLTWEAQLPGCRAQDSRTLGVKTWHALVSSEIRIPAKSFGSGEPKPRGEP